MKEKSKKKPPSRDAKKLLQSFKEAKKATVDVNEGLPRIVDEWTPLEYLKNFAMHGKKITTNSRNIYFGRVNFPLNTLTNFQREYGDKEDSQWYSLEHLYIAYTYR